jgi:hypothetical protein
LSVACPAIKSKPLIQQVAKFQSNLHMHDFHLPPYTITSVGLRVDCPSYGSVKKFTNASFFACIPAGLKT